MHEVLRVFMDFCAVIKKNGESLSEVKQSQTGARSQQRWEQEEQGFSIILCCRAFEGAQAKRSCVSKKQK